MKPEVKQIDHYTSAIRVPGGWIIRTIGPSMELNAGVSSSVVCQTFVPKPEKISMNEVDAMLWWFEDLPPGS